ncbi:DUF4190 domain-containing protein [Serinibacter arcticus]|uniref:Putative integral membrane protein n=1 Tax=Serinibacter arcticus TaxID=1655435 RepID=A0A4Z1DY60_9MICO|nr:DUF4190 domain-containing protein [Serinibacter arcticus]TGO04524.1 putative integral membrane protein [Serinibacter arcticus]
MSYPPPPSNGSDDQPDGEPRYGARLPEGQQPSSQQPPQYGAPSEGFGSPVPPPANPYGGAQPGSEQQLGGPPPFQQQPYGGQPGFGGPSPYAGGSGTNPTQRNALGITALVLGILSVVLFCTTWVATLIGIGAVVVGFFGLSAAKKGIASNRGLSLTGVILGFVGIVASIITLVVVLQSPEFAEMMRDFS